MSPDLKESKPFCSPQDQIQWGILFLSRHLRGSSPWDREQCLQDVWEWARQRGDELSPNFGDGLKDQAAA